MLDQYQIMAGYEVASSNSCSKLCQHGIAIISVTMPGRLLLGWVTGKPYQTTTENNSALHPSTVG